MTTALKFFATACVILIGLNWLSYKVLKRKVIYCGTWDLNVCCGKTDGGGINTDIVKHADIRNLVLADPLYLPFKDKSFGSVVCSHTAEHLHDPKTLMAELNRVGHEVTWIVPPLWDLAGSFNVWEHKWLFISFRKVYLNCLPPYIRLPMAKTIQKFFGQRIHA